MGLLLCRIWEVDQTRERLCKDRGSGVEGHGGKASRNEIGVASPETLVQGRPGTRRIRKYSRTLLESLENSGLTNPELLHWCTEGLDRARF